MCNDFFSSLFPLVSYRNRQLQKCGVIEVGCSAHSFHLNYDYGCRRWLIGDKSDDHSPCSGPNRRTHSHSRSRRLKRLRLSALRQTSCLAALARLLLPLASSSRRSLIAYYFHKFRHPVNYECCVHRERRLNRTNNFGTAAKQSHQQRNGGKNDRHTNKSSTNDCRKKSEKI